MSDINREVGFKITIIREQQGLYQKKLASEAGLYRACISPDFARYLFDMVNKSIHNNPRD